MVFLQIHNVLISCAWEFDSDYDADSVVTMWSEHGLTKMAEGWQFFKWPLIYSLMCVCVCVVFLHSRYANLKQIVLNKLLAKHGDAQLDAQLHEAACMGTLEGGGERASLAVH